MGRYYNIPDVRDGLTEVERTVLLVLYEAQKEFGDRMVPMALLFGRVQERLDLSWEEFSRAMFRTEFAPQLRLGQELPRMLDLSSLQSSRRYGSSSFPE
jgi:hypothetical protein